MKTLLFAALQRIIAVLVGSLNYEKIRALVNDVESTKLTGDQKRERVVYECTSIAVAVGASLLNLAIEAAVVKMKATK